MIIVGCVNQQIINSVKGSPANTGDLEDHSIKLSRNSNYTQLIKMTGKNTNKVEQVFSNQLGCKKLLLPVYSV